VLAGNLIPATQGRRYADTFAIPATQGSDNVTAPVAAQTPLAIVRTGPNSTQDLPAYQYLYTLQNAPLAWLQDEPDALPLPEILLVQQPPDFQPVEWQWRRRLLDAERFENAFTVDPVRFSRIARNSDSSLMQDYDDDSG